MTQKTVIANVMSEDVLGALVDAVRRARDDGAGSIRPKHVQEYLRRAGLRVVRTGSDDGREALYHDIFAEITAKATPLEFDPADPERITAYRVPCGPLHRAAGKLGFQMFDGEKYLAEATAKVNKLEAVVQEIDPKLFEDYLRNMNEKVIPAIVEDQRQNEISIAENRHKPLFSDGGREAQVVEALRLANSLLSLLTPYGDTSKRRVLEGMKAADAALAAYDSSPPSPSRSPTKARGNEHG